jgi:hypothetical protein
VVYLHLPRGLPRGTGLGLGPKDMAIGEMGIGRASVRPKITRDVYLHRPDLREM